MKLSFFNISRNLLCLAVAVLVSMIQAQFFDSGEIFSIAFFIILLLMVPILFIYFLSPNNMIVLFLYTIFLVLLLEVLGKGVDIRILLAFLFCIGLLYAQSHFRYNAERFCTPDPAFGSYFLTLFICFFLVLILSFLIYQHLLTLLPESEKFALFTEENPDRYEETVQNESNEDSNIPDEETSGGGQGGPEEELPPEDPAGPPDVVRILGIIFAAAVCLFLLYIAFRYVRYRLWLRKTLASPPEKQVSEFYRYFLRSFAVCGYPRQEYETPYEYSETARVSGFPVPVSDFAAVTESFVASRFGRRKITSEEQQRVLSLFRSLPGTVKNRLGYRKYVFYYLKKMYFIPK